MDQVHDTETSSDLERGEATPLLRRRRPAPRPLHGGEQTFQIAARPSPAVTNTMRAAKGLGQLPKVPASHLAGASIAGNALGLVGAGADTVNAIRNRRATGGAPIVSGASTMATRAAQTIGAASQFMPESVAGHVAMGSGIAAGGSAFVSGAADLVDAYQNYQSDRKLAAAAKVGGGLLKMGGGAALAVGAGTQDAAASMWGAGLLAGSAMIGTGAAIYQAGAAAHRWWTGGSASTGPAESSSEESSSGEHDPEQLSEDESVHAGRGDSGGLV